MSLENHQEVNGIDKGRGNNSFPNVSVWERINHEPDGAEQLRLGAVIVWENSQVQIYKLDENLFFVMKKLDSGPFFFIPDN